MIGIGGRKAVPSVQCDRLGQHRVRFQPDLSKTATAGRLQKVFEKLLAGSYARALATEARIFSSPVRATLRASCFQ